MTKGEKYIAKTVSGVGIMEILFVGEICIKVKWQNKITEWIYKDDTKTKNNYIDPKVMIIEKIKP
jgi:hypothetical protein